MGEDSFLEKAGEWAWDRREDIARHLAQLREWFRGEGQSASTLPGILILGAGGVGKSTLARLLAAEHTYFNVPGDYDESIGVETYPLVGASGVELTVPPGQKHRRRTTWDAIQTSVARSEYRGIILLAAYGYHSLGQISYKHHRLYQGNKARFLDAYLNEQRQEELLLLRNLAPSIRQCTEKLWMLTVVAKQDLWWRNSAEVEQHYRTGDYGQEIEVALAGRDHRRIRHELVFASLVISRFESGKGEHLVPNIAGYDQKQQVGSLRRLVEIIDSLRKWEDAP